MNIESYSQSLLQRGSSEHILASNSRETGCHLQLDPSEVLTFLQVDFLEKWRGKNKRKKTAVGLCISTITPSFRDEFVNVRISG